MSILVTCPACKRSKKLPDTYARRRLNCSHCRATILAPAPAKTVAPTAKVPAQEFDVELVRLPAAPVNDSSREWAVFSHLVGLVPVPGLTIGVPLVIWLLQRRASSFVAAHAREALNFQLNVLLVALLSVLGGQLLKEWTPQAGGYSWAVASLVLVYGAVRAVVAGRVAQQRRPYRYPVTLRLFR